MKESALGEGKSRKFLEEAVRAWFLHVLAFAVAMITMLITIDLSTLFAAKTPTTALLRHYAILELWDVDPH